MSSKENEASAEESRDLPHPANFKTASDANLESSFEFLYRAKSLLDESTCSLKDSLRMKVPNQGM